MSRLIANHLLVGAFGQVDGCGKEFIKARKETFSEQIQNSMPLFPFKNLLKSCSLLFFLFQDKIIKSYPNGDKENAWK
jgi:hypothetical protein